MMSADTHEYGMMKHFLLQDKLLTHTSSSKCHESRASTECWNIFFLPKCMSTGFEEFWRKQVPRYDCILKTYKAIFFNPLICSTRIHCMPIMYENGIIWNHFSDSFIGNVTNLEKYFIYLFVALKFWYWLSKFFISKLSEKKSMRFPKCRTFVCVWE